jgi:hypothetical protein
MARNTHTQQKLTGRAEKRRKSEPGCHSYFCLRWPKRKSETHSGNEEKEAGDRNGTNHREEPNCCVLDLKTQAIGAQSSTLDGESKETDT